MFALVISVNASIAMVYVLTASNGAPIYTWEYQPTVILAIASTISNVALQYALAQAVTIAWWVRAMKFDTKVQDLHNIWVHGNNLEDVLCAGGSLNLIALAGLAVTLVPINGPLLQRASLIGEHTKIETKTLTIEISQSFISGYTGIITGRSHEAGLIEKNFSYVLNDYSNRVPINITDSGCKGTCTGRLPGAGYQMQCLNDTIPFNLTYRGARPPKSNGQTS